MLKAARKLKLKLPIPKLVREFDIGPFTLMEVPPSAFTILYRFLSRRSLGF